MKIVLACIACFLGNIAQAASAPLLQRALECQLADGELPSLMQALRAGTPALPTPLAQYGAPAIDVYRLDTALSAWGYSSNTVAIAPGRILLAVADRSADEAANRLHLEKIPYSPAARTVRPTVSIIAYSLSLGMIQGQLLVGCEYANPAAASWVRD